MTKKDNKNFHPAEDYLAQLHWQNKHLRRTSVYYEPQWRYNILYKNKYYTSAIPLILFISTIVALIVFLIYLVIVKHSEKAIFGLIFSILGAAILFYAIRDAGKLDDNDDDIDDITDSDIQ
jgi:hypothetical protein